MGNRNNLTNLGPDQSGHKEEVGKTFKKQIVRSFTIVIYALIIGSAVLATFNGISSSAAELVVKKLGTTPHSAEIIVDGDSKMYELVGGDLDILMAYLDDL